MVSLRVDCPGVWKGSDGPSSRGVTRPVRSAVQSHDCRIFPKVSGDSAPTGEVLTLHGLSEEQSLSRFLVGPSIQGMRQRGKLEGKRHEASPETSISKPGQDGCPVRRGKGGERVPSTQAECR